MRTISGTAYRLAGRKEDFRRENEDIRKTRNKIPCGAAIRAALSLIVLDSGDQVMTLQQKQAVDSIALEIDGILRRSRGREFWRATAVGGLAVGATLLGAAILACQMNWMCVFWIAW